MVPEEVVVFVAEFPEENGRVGLEALNVCLVGAGLDVGAPGVSVIVVRKVDDGADAVFGQGIQEVLVRRRVGTHGVDTHLGHLPDVGLTHGRQAQDQVLAVLALGHGRERHAADLVRLTAHQDLSAFGCHRLEAQGLGDRGHRLLDHRLGNAELLVEL